jgi:hypothetical protein
LEDMKKILTILLLFTCSFSKAQVNMVRNGSFERHDTCPNDLDEVKYALGWMSLDSTWSPPDWAHSVWGVPEYCNVCAGASSSCGAPASGLFYQYPRTGNGMIQVQMYHDGHSEQDRDYLQGHLGRTLTAGQSYCVTFYVVQEDGSSININNIGAYLDDGSIDTTLNPGFVQTLYTPQVLETAVISDTLNWTKIQGSFIANGTERLITIGNFADTAHTTHIIQPWLSSAPGGFSFYLVDDVSVIKSTRVANAGPDRTITSSHDTVAVGDTSESYLPCVWYVNGVAVDSNKGGFLIHVDTTTTFVMELDVCGHITFDTVVVSATYELANLQPKLLDVQIFPNPAINQLTITNASGGTFVIHDVLGKEIYHISIASNKQSLNIASLPNGVYTAIVTSQFGEKKNLKLIKQ